MGHYENEAFIFFGMNQNKSRMIFTHVDFTSLFNRTCERDDYYPWTFTRNGETCYQGHEIVYFVKNINSFCINNYTSSLQIKHNCPCFVQDFQCRFNYYYNDGYCELDRYSDLEIHQLNCESNLKPIRYLNGFSKLHPGICSPRQYDPIKDDAWADVCTSNEYSNEILFFSKNMSFVCVLDYMGDPLPKFITVNTSLPNDINPMFPMVVDMVTKFIFYYSNDTISLYLNRDYNFNKIELYSFSFKIKSIAIDHFLDLLFILDLNHTFFVISMKTNFVKLLAENVTDFEYSNSNLSVSFNKPGQLCFYRFDSNIKCSQTYLDVKKFIFYEEHGYSGLLIRNHTLLIYEVLKTNLISKKQPILYVDSVDFFGIIKYNLFFMQNATLIRVDLRYPTRFDLVTNNNFSDIIKMSLNVVYFKNPYNNAQDGCKYQCNPMVKSEAFCYCTENEYNQIYSCESGDTECLRKYCAGFHCASSECLTNNVMCNGIHECRDGSDENNCKKICQESEHLCETDCLPKNILCPAYKYKFLHGIVIEKLGHTNKITKDYSTAIISFSTALIIILVLLFLKKSKAAKILFKLTSRKRLRPQHMTKLYIHASEST
ncbi:VPS10 domain-containing receptor SorCS1 [Thelohanellus kitauei]|uniref:VPS10 domain-containing receptor SorCS1 n=1 Tax=Thelohanellus kitauei TaxID=669202 RepID=A0A0C2JTV6_THEKT|nr:VPS10 domain-containing receptor SorCS1 [Thelohanellus kitauei]